MQEPIITTTPIKLLIGMSVRMSISENKNYLLWSTFMPRKKEITNTIGTELYALQEYNTGQLDNFSPTHMFTQWAATVVMKETTVPPQMDIITIPAGLYAVFVHRGLASAIGATLNHIFQEWLPNSPYELDDRVHFQVMGDKYKNNAIDSEETVWIPIKDKNNS